MLQQLRDNKMQPGNKMQGGLYVSAPDSTHPADGFPQN